MARDKAIFNTQVWAHRLCQPQRAKVWEFCKIFDKLSALAQLHFIMGITKVTFEFLMCHPTYSIHYVELTIMVHNIIDSNMASAYELRYDHKNLSGCGDNSNRIWHYEWTTNTLFLFCKQKETLLYSFHSWNCFQFEKYLLTYFIYFPAVRIWRSTLLVYHWELVKPVYQFWYFTCWIHGSVCTLIKLHSGYSWELSGITTWAS